jgi:starch-binding outer membrane protein, SusD/RagB family
MRTLLKCLVVAPLLLPGATACVDLDVENRNNPDAARSVSTPEDVLSLIGGSFGEWFYGNYSFYGAGLALSNAAFQHNAPWANAGMERYGRIPRIAFINRITDSDYNYLTRPWFYAYRAAAAVADGLRALEDPEVASRLTADELASGRAFGKFVQGMAHATVAVLFAEGFVVDELSDMVREGGRLVPDPGKPVPYGQLMEAAKGYFEECIVLSGGAGWILPEGWMKARLTGPELARTAHSMRARYAAALARTPAEREALDWSAILSDVDAGITHDLILDMDSDTGWSNDVLGYGTYFGWSQMAYFLYGMADQSGSFQAWNALALPDKRPTMEEDPVLIITPDLRFPQGSTLEAQRASPGLYFRISGATETGATWARPDRGTWRWSWYKHSRGGEYWSQLARLQPEIRTQEMRLLKAEALYHRNDPAGAAAIVNETRVAAGLSSTDAGGTNTSCVPKLPDGTCGGLFEMLKWEKRMENTFKGPLGNLWYFDGRGWGDLWKGTFLHLPIPCGEAQVVGLLPCQTFGGPAGPMGAAPSVYGWHGEG